MADTTTIGTFGWFDSAGVDSTDIGTFGWFGGEDVEPPVVEDGHRHGGHSRRRPVDSRFPPEFASAAYARARAIAEREEEEAMIAALLLMDDEDY